MIHPIDCDPRVSPVVCILDPVGWRAGRCGTPGPGPDPVPDNAVYFVDVSQAMLSLPVTFNGYYLVVTNV